MFCFSADDFTSLVETYLLSVPRFSLFKKIREISSSLSINPTHLVLQFLAVPPDLLYILLSEVICAFR